MKTNSELTLSNEEKLTLLGQLIDMRCFQTAALREYNAGHMAGFLILSVGQEGLAVAAKSLMQPDDHLICGVRSLSYALACGMSMEGLMAELFGKSSGCAHGKGGMFGFFAPQLHFHGGYACAGTQTPLGTGIAFALKYQQKKGIALCVLGDGATDQGAFHEALNLASLFNLPIVFIIENNQYSIWTSTARHVANKTDPLAQRAEGYNMDWDVVSDGSDINSLRSSLYRAMETARQQRRPVLLEVQTYRFYGFSIADGNSKKHRTAEEIKYHREHHDPLKNWSELLKQEGLLDDKTLKDYNLIARQKVEAAIRFAETAPSPQISDLTKHVYWEADQPHRTSQGALFFK